MGVGLSLLALQGGFVDFPQARVGKLIAKLDDGWHLVAGDSGLKPFEQNEFTERPAVLSHHHGFEALAEFTIWDTDDGGGIDQARRTQKCLEELG